MAKSLRMLIGGALMLAIAGGLIYLRFSLNKERHQEHVEASLDALSEALESTADERAAAFDLAREEALSALKVSMLGGEPYSAFLLDLCDRLEEIDPNGPAPEHAEARAEWHLARGELERADEVLLKELHDSPEEDLGRPRLELMRRLVEDLQARR